MSCFSTPSQLKRLCGVLESYLRLPFSGDFVPGAIMEGALAHVRGAEVLKTYDFVDVVSLDERTGWQVKSTKAGTPVTWKRAKIPNQVTLIEASRRGSRGCQELGDAIIAFCNAHAAESIRKYDLDEIGYCRLVVEPDLSVIYFERQLCTRSAPVLFDPTEFEWRWSAPKVTVKKEQLQSLHGIHRPTGRKWWAWHGLGENQLHFSGESAWWPGKSDPHCARFKVPAQRMTVQEFLALLAKA